MERSRLPLSSLLGLFGALLMLSPELVLGIPEVPAKLPVTNPEVGKALAFAIEKYNQNRRDSSSYFKVLSVQESLMQVEIWVEFSLTVQLVKTRCKKRAFPKLSYKNIQKCKTLPGKQEKRICFFKVTQVVSKMELEATSCS